MTFILKMYMLPIPSVLFKARAAWLQVRVCGPCVRSRNTGAHLQHLGLSVCFLHVCGRRWDPGWESAFPQVSATFAASLVSSPAIGAYLSASYGDSLVVLVATVVALLDICFILLAVPESLPEKMRPLSWGAKISWKQADPFAVNKYPFLSPVKIEKRFNCK